MARLRRRTVNPDAMNPGSLAPTTNEDIIQSALDRLVERLDKDKIRTVKSNMLVAVQKPNGEWRNKAITPSEEMIFANVRLGASKNILFGFKPMNPEWALVEIPHSKVFEAMENFEKEAVEALGFKYENVLTNEDGEAISFNLNFLTALQKFEEAEIKRRQIEAEEAEKRKEEEAHKRSEDNPLWGAF